MPPSRTRLPYRPVREALPADLRRMVPVDGRSAARWRLEVVVKAVVFPRVLAVVVFRFGQVLARRRGLLPLAYLLSSHAVARSGAEISPLASIGPGLELTHSVGVVIGADVVIGSGATIYHGVTVGDGSRPGRPVIGDDVLLGAGSCVLGGIQVGDRVLVGAQAVVTTDLPDDVVATGIPATYRRNNAR
jgi:serine O-acetyltransferase